MEPELKDPLGPSANPAARGLVDKQRLLDAWERNVQTQQGVMDHLARAQRSIVLTRYVSIIVLMVIAGMVYVVSVATKTQIQIVQDAQRERREADEGMVSRLAEQDHKLELVLDSVTRLLEAKLAEDASRRAPKDLGLKAEVTRSRAEALVTTLEAKQAVAPPPAAKAAGARLEVLKAEARDKGVDLQGVAPAPAIPLF